jgi:hypothetical protein
LSDYSANYPLLRLNGQCWPCAIHDDVDLLQDINEKKFDTFGSNRRKWGLFHYLDWNVNNSLSFGFFNAYIVPEADDQGNRRGFDVNFINPLIFAYRVQAHHRSRANTLVGFTGKYKMFDKNAAIRAVIDRSL